MAENSDYLKEQKGTVGVQTWFQGPRCFTRRSELKPVWPEVILFVVSAFREGSKDREGEGARDLQRKEGNGTHPEEL